MDVQTSTQLVCKVYSARYLPTRERAGYFISQILRRFLHVPLNILLLLPVSTQRTGSLRHAYNIEHNQDKLFGTIDVYVML